MQREIGRVEMSGEGGESKRVSTAQLQAIENQLFSLVRQQAKQNHPIELPRPDFWAQVSTLLANIDIELAEVGKSEGWSVKAQNLSRRQGNVRRSVADLTQHRLTAFVRHASTNNLASAPYGDVLGEEKSPLNPLDWQRHDAAERAFYEGLNSLIEKYKHHVSWNVLQKGLVGETEQTPVVEQGTVQLDSFVKDEGGITGQGPPKVVVKEVESQPYEDPDEDEEERIAKMSAYPTSGMVNPDVTSKEDSHPTESVSAEEKEDSTDAASEGMIRIKMLTDLPTSIMDSNGNELELMQGDVEYCETDFATGLIAAGFAEDASIA